jgi:hypothetical protein
MDQEDSQAQLIKERARAPTQLYESNNPLNMESQDLKQRSVMTGASP